MNIIVKDYDPNWVSLFEIEAEKIRKILKEELIAVHHIGSTAVSDLKAKPIIDIMPVVGITGRRYLRKGGANRTHHIHIFQQDNQLDIERHLAVRDYLRGHEEMAIAYGELKGKLAAKFPADIAKYSDGKHDFVQNLEQLAMEWKREKRS